MIELKSRVELNELGELRKLREMSELSECMLRRSYKPEIRRLLKFAGTNDTALYKILNLVLNSRMSKRGAERREILYNTPKPVELIQVF